MNLIRIFTRVLGFYAQPAVFFILAIQLTLMGCATRPTFVNHSFSFDTIQDSPGIEVLDYQYGYNEEYEKSRQIGIHADKERVAMGKVFPAQSTSGPIPRGDFLYVKWRIKQSGQIYEDRVDLTTRLPKDIKNYKIHFAIFDSKLYIYLFPPFESKDAFGHITVNGGQPPYVPRGQLLMDNPYAQKNQIYPDQPKR
jgi:hypothetical protein